MAVANRLASHGHTFASLCAGVLYWHKKWRRFPFVRKRFAYRCEYLTLPMSNGR